MNILFLRGGLKTIEIKDDSFNIITSFKTNIDSYDEFFEKINSQYPLSRIGGLYDYCPTYYTDNRYKNGLIKYIKKLIGG